LLLLQVLIFNFQFSIVAQREADCLAMGYCDYSLPNCHPSYGSAIYKFNEEGIEYIEEDARLSLSTDYSRAAFSDRHTGELIFASNGWRLVNRSGQVLAHKLYNDDIPHPGGTPDTTNVNNTLGPLFLNDPGDSTKAYLFYGQRRLEDFPGIGFAGLDVLFTYAYLDIPTQSLISKGNTVLNELTLRADAAACRHANGRDWWLIKPGIYEDENYFGLLDPKGVNMEKQTYPGLQHRVQIGHTFTYFNQQGDKMLRFVSLNGELHVFDFDRCSGELSNLVVHDLSDSLGRGTDWNACNISPDGTKFYVRRSPSKGGGTLQYDLETLEYTYITRISTAPQLTPNYKHILLGNSLFTSTGKEYQTLCTIYKPNEPGLACNYVANTDTVINFPNFIAPSCFANFRLGALKGSGCDTIVSGMGEVKVGRVKVYPNPARDVLTVELEQAANYQINIYNALGQRVYFARTAGKSKIIDLSNLPLHSGLLLVEVMNEETRAVLKTKVIYEK